MKQGQYSELGNSQYQLMTSVSMPVYDLRHNEVGSVLCVYFYLLESLNLFVITNRQWEKTVSRQLELESDFEF